MSGELRVGAPEEAPGLLESAEDGEGFAFDGLDNVKLITLWSILERGTPNDRIEERLRALGRLSKGEQGPWVDVVPPAMLASLAEIPSLEEKEFEGLAARWKATAEFAGWDPEDVGFLLQQTGELAESASLQQKTLLLRQAL